FTRATASWRATGALRDALPIFLSGDTLFEGGPGATGRSHSDFGTIIDSISGRLLILPEDTVVHTGHGGDTTIGAEKPHLQEWIEDRKSTRLNSSHVKISYAVFC